MALNKLLSYFPAPLMNKVIDWPGVEKHKEEICKFFGSWVCVIDRTETYKGPFECEIKWPIPLYDSNFNLSYKDVCIRRAIELYDYAKKSNKKIRLYYSGGIDSSVILCSFIEALGLQETAKMVELAVTENSIRENPTLWDSIVRKNNFYMVSSSIASNIISKTHITLTGECNDQLFGSDKIMGFMALLGEDVIYKKWTPDSIEKFLVFSATRRDLNPGPLVEYLRQTMEAAPFKIENNYQFWWWYNFAWKWNNVATRLLYYIPTKLAEQTKSGFEVNQFFNSTEFQQWSMKNHCDEPDKNGLPYEYKMAAKEFVVEVTKDKGFLDKTKNPSLLRALQSQFRIHAIDSKYNLITDYKDFQKYLRE
jgi:hypothetical protein